MGYIEKNLLPGENVVYWARLHPIIFLVPAILALVGFAAFALSWIPAVLILIAVFYGHSPGKRSWIMRIFWIVAALMCLMLPVSLSAFADEQKGKTEAYGNQKEGYQKEAEAKLKELKRKMEELKVKSAELKDEAKVKFDQEMKEMKKKEAAANKKLKKLKAASAETWEKVKAEVDSAMEDLDRQYDKMMAHFKKT